MWLVTKSSLRNNWRIPMGRECHYSELWSICVNLWALFTFKILQMCSKWLETFRDHGTLEVEKNMEKPLRCLEPSKEQFCPQSLEKCLFFVNFGYFLPSNFCNSHQNELKFSWNFLLIVFQSLLKTHDNSVLQSSKTPPKTTFSRNFDNFKAILPPEDDFITKILCNFLVWQYSRRFQKSN